jgi:hypothetical protein
VAAGFRARGFAVEQTQDGADGGVDLHLFQGDERAAVQVKHFPTRQVGVDTVRSLLGVLQLTGLSRGYLVSSGEFTPDAWAEAQRAGIVLIRGQDTLALVNEAITAGFVVPQLVDDPAPGVPRCPICRRPMVLRHVKKGARAGQPFWGCPEFPDCRGRRQIADAGAVLTQAPTPPSASAAATPTMASTTSHDASPAASGAAAPPMGPLAAHQVPATGSWTPPTQAAATSNPRTYALRSMPLPPAAYQPIRQPRPFHQQARAGTDSPSRPAARTTATSRPRKRARDRLIIFLVQLLVMVLGGWYLVNVALPSILKSSLSRPPLTSTQSPSPTKR